MTVQAGDKEYLRNTLAEPMPAATSAGVTGAGTHAAPGASTARRICEEERIPNPRSHDEYEKKLGYRFANVLRRRYRAIGVWLASNS